MICNNDYVLTQSDVVCMFNYCVNTGVFTYAKDTPRKKQGDTVGYTANGYLKTAIKGKQYHLSRLAWMYVYGVFPDDCIDHINHNKLDNSISNLRDVTRAENSKNQRTRKDSKSGCNGVYWNQNNEDWSVYFNGDLDNSYDTYPEAVARRKTLEKANGYHKNHNTTKTYNHRDAILEMYKQRG